MGNAFVTTHTVEEVERTGVYHIKQISTGRLYVGSASRSFRDRWNRHLKELNRKEHHSCFLQRAWDKHGSADFLFEIVELYDISQGTNTGLLDIEQKHLDLSKPEFNMSPTAYSRKGVKATEETRLKNSLALKGKKRGTPSEETKQKISRSNIGKHHASSETRRKMAEAKIGNNCRSTNFYTLKSPSGQEIIVNNLKEFCRNNDLTYQNLCAVIRGTRKTSQGWSAVKNG